MIKFKFNISNKSFNTSNRLKGIDYSKIDEICVYFHYYNNENLPFYIGEGTISRAYSAPHKSRSKQWWNKVQDINLVKVVIVNIGITKDESIRLEEDYIKSFEYDNCLVNVHPINANHKRSINIINNKGEEIQSFSNIIDAANNLCTTIETIKYHIRKNKPFRGYWFKYL